MTIVQNVSELQKVILWFLDLPEVDSVYKLELIEYMQETNVISLEVLVYIDQILEENTRIQAQKLQELEHAKNLLESLSTAEKTEETSMKVALIKEAESFLQEVSSGFKSDWISFVHTKDVEAENVEYSENEALAQSLKDKLTK